MIPVCLVIGAGAGIGGTVGKKFAREGYHAVLCRRSDKDGLEKLVSDIEASGGQATGRLLNAIDDNTIEDLIADVENTIGPIEVVIYNLGAQIGDRSCTRECGPALSRGGHGRAAHALPDAECAICLKGHPCCAHPGGWRG